MAAHYFGWVDPERVALVNCLIGSPFSVGLFGNPWAPCTPLSYYLPNVLRFPGRSAS
jgi:hypothetical protein